MLPHAHTRHGRGSRHAAATAGRTGAAAIAAILADGGLCTRPGRLPGPKDGRPRLRRLRPGRRTVDFAQRVDAAGGVERHHRRRRTSPPHAATAPPPRRLLRRHCRLRHPLSRFFRCDSIPAPPQNLRQRHPQRQRRLLRRLRLLDRVRLRPADDGTDGRDRTLGHQHPVPAPVALGVLRRKGMPTREAVHSAPSGLAEHGLQHHLRHPPDHGPLLPLRLDARRYRARRRRPGRGQMEARAAAEGHTPGRDAPLRQLRGQGGIRLAHSSRHAEPRPAASQAHRHHRLLHHRRRGRHHPARGPLAAAAHGPHLDGPHQRHGRRSPRTGVRQVLG